LLGSSWGGGGGEKGWWPWWVRPKERARTEVEADRKSLRIYRSLPYYTTSNCVPFVTGTFFFFKEHTTAVELSELLADGRG
jgi:hypothetical protein